jgi:hypothetical protein
MQGERRRAWKPGATGAQERPGATGSDRRYWSYGPPALDGIDGTMGTDGCTTVSPGADGPAGRRTRRSSRSAAAPGGHERVAEYGYVYNVAAQ